MSDIDKKAKTLFAKTAQHIRALQDENARLQHENEQLKEATDQNVASDRALKLAKRAAERGLIDKDIESIDDFAKQALGSDRSLDVIEQGLEFAVTQDFAVKSAAEAASDSHGSNGRMDPISRTLFGTDFD